MDYLTLLCDKQQHWMQSWPTIFFVSSLCYFRHLVVYKSLCWCQFQGRYSSISQFCAAWRNRRITLVASNCIVYTRSYIFHHKEASTGGILAILFSASLRHKRMAFCLREVETLQFTILIFKKKNTHHEKFLTLLATEACPSVLKWRTFKANESASVTLKCVVFSVNMAWKMTYSKYGKSLCYHHIQCCSNKNMSSLMQDLALDDHFIWL